MCIVMGARKAVADALRDARKQAGFPDAAAPQRPQHSLPVIDLTDDHHGGLADAQLPGDPRP